MTLGEFAFEARQNPQSGLVQKAGLTEEEWQSVKDFVFLGAILYPEIFETAETKVSKV